MTKVQDFTPDILTSPHECGHLLLQTFDLVKIINLRERGDRRRQIAQELARIGLKAGEGGVELLEASRFKEAQGFPSIGHRGCFDSHVRVLEEARDRKCRSLLILEDDCDFSRDIVRLLPSALRALEHENWSLFYGGHLGWGGAAEARPPLAQAQPNQGFLGTHFLGLRAEAVELAIPYLKAMRERPEGSPEGGPMSIDGAYGWFRAAHPALETWAAVPILGHQRPSRTDIADLRSWDSSPLLRSAVSLAREFRRHLVKRRR